MSARTIAVSRERAKGFGLRVAYDDGCYSLRTPTGEPWGLDCLPDRDSVATALDELAATYRLGTNDDGYPIIRPVRVLPNGEDRWVVFVPCPFCGSVHRHSGPLPGLRRSHCVGLLSQAGTYLIVDADGLITQQRKAS